MQKIEIFVSVQKVTPQIMNCAGFYMFNNIWKVRTVSRYHKDYLLNIFVKRSNRLANCYKLCFVELVFKNKNSMLD